MLDPIDWLNGWQTFVAALIALAAAGWAIGQMRQQEFGDDRRHKEQTTRRKLAALAQMPDALSELTEYARACASHLLDGAELPPSPVNALSVLKEVIEHIDTDEAEKLFVLVS